MGIRKLRVVLLKFSRNCIDFSRKERKICLVCFVDLYRQLNNKRSCWHLYIAHPDPVLDMVTKKVPNKRNKCLVNSYEFFAWTLFSSDTSSHFCWTMEILYCNSYALRNIGDFLLFLGATKEPPIAFAFPVFFFGRHTAPSGSSQDLYRILITMHRKMRLKILRAMA